MFVIEGSNEMDEGATDSCPCLSISTADFSLLLWRSLLLLFVVKIRSELAPSRLVLLVEVILDRDGNRNR